MITARRANKNGLAEGLLEDKRKPSPALAAFPVSSTDASAILGCQETIGNSELWLQGVHSGGAMMLNKIPSKGLRPGTNGASERESVSQSVSQSVSHE